MSVVFFFFKQKTAYELRIGDGISDVCSSDLDDDADGALAGRQFVDPRGDLGPLGVRLRRHARRGLAGIDALAAALLADVLPLHEGVEAVAVARHRVLALNDSACGDQSPLPRPALPRLHPQPRGTAHTNA